MLYLYDMKHFTIRHKIISFVQDIDIRGIRKIAYYLPKILIPKPSVKLTIKTQYGFCMEIDPVKDMGLERSIYYTGTYEKGTLYIMEYLLEEGNIFVDVGANIGLMSIFASYIVKGTGKVFAFEPNPNTLEILKRNIELNGISNIETSNKAIGNTSGTSKLYDHWDSSRGSASLHEPNYSTDSYPVNVISLRDHFGNNGQQIHLIKMDIEGYELEALNGAKELIASSAAPMLIIECSDIGENSSGSNKKNLFDLIKNSNSYKIFKLNGGAGRVSKLLEIISEAEMPDNDNIFCFTEKHIERIPNKLFKCQTW
ncbi:MAG TPA: FkbM family methyltransferase [Flavobacteriales bacterium]|nr:FkbM family methyltransferase [Flavobacteriales bacterium]HIN40211.1 FkbM family methyltransferase [Flavobacteriales bacterium]